MVCAVCSVTSNRFSRLCVFLLALSCAAASPVVSNLAPANSQPPAHAPLVDFQVSEPVLTPTGSSNENGCVYSQVLMSHVFANSYGVPYTGTTLKPADLYSPP